MKRRAFAAGYVVASIAILVLMRAGIASAANYPYTNTVIATTTIDASNTQQTWAFAMQSSTLFGAGVPLTDSNTEFFALNISSSSDPQLISTTTISTTSTVSSLTGIAVQGNYLYLATYTGSAFMVYNVSNPSLPAFVGSTTVPCSPIYSLTVYEGYAYAGCQSGYIGIINATDPAAPAAVGAMATPSSTNPDTVAVSGDTLYASDPSEAQSYLTAYSLADPAAPAMVANVPVDHSPQRMWVQGDLVAVTMHDTNEVEFIDFSNINDPATSTVALTPSCAPEVQNGITIVGNRTFVGCFGASGIDVIDNSVTSSPKLLGQALTSLTGTNGQGPMAVVGSYMYLGDSYSDTVHTIYFGIDSSLSSLAVSTGTLSPSFSPATFSYNEVLPPGTTSTPAITATLNDSNATDTVTQATSTSGMATVVVTSEDGTESSTYSVHFSIAHTDAALSSLAVSNGILSPSFSTSTLSYADVLPYGTNAVPTVTPTLDDVTATDTVTQATSTSGTATVVVTAQDGVTQQAYTVSFSVSPTPPVVVAVGGGGGGGSYTPPPPPTPSSSTSSTSATSTSTSTSPSSSPMTATSTSALLLQLEAELRALTGQVVDQGSYIFTRNLTVGSSGIDVQALQHYLNMHGFPVTAIPGNAGSLGYETRYFGTGTAGALAKFQKAEGIMPAIGFFGPITRAYVNAHE